MKHEYDSPYYRLIHRRMVQTMLIPLCIMGILLAATIPVILYFGVSNSNQQQGEQLSSRFSRQLIAYREELSNLAQNPSLVEYLRTGQGKSKAYELLYQARNRQQIGANFQLVGRDGAYQLADNPSWSSGRYESAKDSWLHSRLAETSGVLEHTLITPRPGTSDGTVVFSLAVKIGPSPEEWLGSLSMIFTDAQLKQMFARQTCDVVLVNASDYILFASGLNQSGDYKKFLPRHIFAHVYATEQELIILQAFPLSGSSMTLYAMENFTFIRPVAITGIFISAVMIVLMLCFTYLLGWQVTAVTLEPFNHLFYALSRYGDGDVDYRITIHHKDEASGYLALFNNILDEINLLLKKNEDLAEQTRVSQIRTLQSQFNPHFMFNLLDAIQYMIYIDQEQACQMVLSLSKLLRYSIAGTKDSLVTLGEDLAYTKDYLVLHKTRLGVAFHYQIKVPDPLLDFKVPKMLLQPIIENSITHGFSSQENFQIVIRARTVGSTYLEIVVLDNGVGMKRQELRELRERLNSESSDFLHIGLMNTNRRLQLHYGPGCGLRLQSKQGCGTRVILKLHQWKAPNTNSS